MKNEIKQLKISDKEYPVALKEISSSPEVLYYRGNLGALKYKHAVAIVGTRRCSQYGREATRQITKTLAQAGVTIISGLARGIDTEAHKIALEHNGPTIAVLGTGLDDKSMYPKQNLKLMHKIIEAGGLVLSEYPEGTQGFVGNFPARNRIVAGLSDATVVAEAPQKSGTMITANWAKKFNKKIYAVPGSIFSRLSEGANLLLQNGAKPIFNGAEILEDLKVKKTQKLKATQLNLNDLEKRVLQLIADSASARHVDKIIQKLNVDSNSISIALTSLVLSDLIKETSPNCYVAVK